MASYTKATDFAAKDALLSGDPNKIIKGTEIDNEFNAISVAVGTKADTVSPTFTGTPTAPTASPGTNTTQLATTAFVTAADTAFLSSALAAVYPVGSIYINASVSTNPGTLLGFGTWTAFGAGRVMVGFNASDTLFDTAEETGGSKDAIVVSHTHAATVTDPGHAHTSAAGPGPGSTNLDPVSASTQQLAQVGTTTGTNTTGITVTNASTGSSGTNANLQPYITCYFWKRTA